MTTQDLRLPEMTRLRLEQFRRRVRIVKVAEGLLAGVFGLVVSCLAVFCLDRCMDTSAAVRSLILVFGSAGFSVVLPLKWHRWVWGTRRLEQVARLLKPRFPGLADQLLSVVELARQRDSLGASSTLALAAIRHVDALVQDRDFSTAVPQPRHRRWALAVSVPAGVLLVVMLLVPAAGWNAVARWLLPWRPVERYTFARIERLPEQLVVPQGEPFALNVALTPSSVWNPSSATTTVNGQLGIAATRQQNVYQFPIPPQAQGAELDVRVGDVREHVRLQAAPRPELLALQATVRLPDYLQYPRPVQTDVRGGAVTLVKGAVAEFSATISRDLLEAAVAEAAADTAADQKTPTGAEVPAASEGGDAGAMGASEVAVAVQGPTIVLPPVAVADNRQLQLQWRDALGLTPQAPFRLRITAVDDAPPSVTCQQAQRTESIVLSTDVISLEVAAQDDFGVREIGLVWSGSTAPAGGAAAEGAVGEKVALAGGPEVTRLQAVTTFCAETDGVRPQKLELRAYAEDYRPERGRVYSPVHIVQVMSPEEHAVWIADQLSRWASRAEDVYEEELRLHETNRELRQLPASELARSEVQRSLEQQAAAEQANAARLGAVAAQGRELIQQALRNTQMQAGHLEAWAGALQQLDQISRQRMPSVAGLLTAAAASAGGAAAAAQADSQSPPSAGQPGQGAVPGQASGQGGAAAPQPGTADNPAGPMAGQQRNAPAGGGEDSEAPPQAAGQPLPQLVDVESGFNPPQPPTAAGESQPQTGEEQPPQAGGGRFSLPSTVLSGGPQQPPGDEGETQTKPGALNQAVEDQSQLLLEFETAREDLQRIMDDLENSTFVKRFKAASRRQLEVADDLNRTLLLGFGLDRGRLAEQQAEHTRLIAERELEQSRLVSSIQTDLEAYLGRKSEDKFVRILEEMQQLDVVAQLGGVAERVQGNLTGEAIARAEFWADTLDRWGEELVSVSKSGNKSSGGNSRSLPPAIVLEIMRILDGEIDLREETRALDQSRAALTEAVLTEKIQQQAVTQSDLQDRTLQVLTDIQALPEGDVAFLKELESLTAAGAAMSDAVGLLRQAQTGPEVIAAETEVIELLLQARRAGAQGGGGGSGNTPGKGGDGATDQAALALYGPGLDAQAVIEKRDVRQLTGTASDEYPAEFREGLDAFFQALEQGQP